MHAFACDHLGLKGNLVIILYTLMHCCLYLM